jgi:hypothetical protein
VSQGGAMSGLVRQCAAWAVDGSTEGHPSLLLSLRAVMVRHDLVSQATAWPGGAWSGWVMFGGRADSALPNFTS